MMLSVLKNQYIKQKKQIFMLKQTEIFAQTNANTRLFDLDSIIGHEELKFRTNKIELVYVNPFK